MQPRAVIPAGGSATPTPGIFLRHGPHQRVAMGRPGAPWDTFGPSGNRSPLAPVFRAAECHAAEVSQVPFPTAGRFTAELRIYAVSSADNLTYRNYALHELTKDTPSLVIWHICVSDSGRFVLSHLAPRGFCTRTVRPERATNAEPTDRDSHGRAINSMTPIDRDWSRKLPSDDEIY